MCFNIVNVNINSYLFISRYFLAKFQQRFEKHGKRSALINVSSIAAVRPSALTTVYGASKAFDRVLSLGMDQEYSSYVDVMSVMPMSTRSNMNSGIYIGTISAEDHANAVVN